MRQWVGFLTSFYLVLGQKLINVIKYKLVIMEKGLDLAFHIDSYVDRIGYNNN